MENVSVFLVDCELAGESPPLRAQGYAGVFVTCVIATSSIGSAIREAEAMLDEDGYKTVDISKAARFEDKEWLDDPEMTKLAQEVRSSGESLYSDFEAWGH